MSHPRAATSPPQSMPTLQTQSTTGVPITVIYPAERPPGSSTPVRFRVGKKTVLAAYTDANLPFMVQFQRDRRITMFTLSDVLETSYWQKIRNAYSLFGHLDIEADLRVGANETERVVGWLKEESAARGIVVDYWGLTTGKQ